MPFQLDTRIPASAQGPTQRSPLQSLGLIGQLQAQQELGENRRLMNEQRQRQLEDDDAIRSTLPQYDRPDDAVEALYRQGRPGAAAMLSKNLFEYRTSQANALKTDLDNRKAKMKMASQIVRGVLLDGTENAWQSAKPAVSSLVGEDLASHLPSTFDKKTLEGALAWGDEYDSYLDGQIKATEAATKAMDLQHKPEVDAVARAKNQAEALKLWTTAASNAFSTARNQQQVDSVRAAMIGAGAPPVIFDQFGDFDEGFNERARHLGMTGAEEGQEKHSAALEKQAEANAKETARFHNAQIGHWNAQDARANATAAAGGRGLTANAQSELKVRKHKAYDDAEKVYAEAVKDLVDPSTGKLHAKATVEEKQQYANVTHQHGMRKVQIEDAFRDEMGMPPILQTEYQLRGDKSKAADLKKIRSVYKALTGEETPLEQLTKINAILKSGKEEDGQPLSPQRRQQLIQAGEALSNLYSSFKR